MDNKERTERARMNDLEQKDNTGEELTEDDRLELQKLKKKYTQSRPVNQTGGKKSRRKKYRKGKSKKNRRKSNRRR